MKIESTSAEIAWAAGLFEGEGCWGVYRRSDGTMQVLAKLASTDRDVVERFHRIVGCGSVHRPKVDPRPNRKPLHTWVVYEAAKVRALVEMVRPWLGQRRRAKAEEVAAVAATIPVATAQRTHCPQGHPYAGANLGLTKESRATHPQRYCKTCRRASHKRRIGVAA